MPLRKVSAKEERFIKIKSKFEHFYKEFEDYAELLSNQQGNVKKSSGKASSYARNLIYLAVLYEENFQRDIGDLNSLEGFRNIQQIKELEGFKDFSISQRNFPSAAINCYTNFMQNKEKLNLNSDLVNFSEDEMTSNNIIKQIYNFISARGFLYSDKDITNLYLSLRSKPFVILSGISGTGKTKIVQLFANAVGATQENGRYRLISVRPDWSDSSDLLGYTNLKGEFVCGQLTDMVIRASTNSEQPHFVVLDEMNLARVEYYLSDYLSVIESREFVNGQIETAPLVRVDKKEYGLPDNLYIIGTVNMDETTYPFSKKVLDRANSIEFNEINLTSYNMLSGQNEEVSPKNVYNNQFVSQYLYLKDAYPQHEETIEMVSIYLENINQHLKEIYAQVGYRVRDEICFYMIYAKETDLSELEAMDFCIMQKILPRISGAGPDVEDLLKALYKEFASVEYVEKVAIPAAAKYPQSAKKVQEMIKRLGRQGFTSFWVS